MAGVPAKIERNTRVMSLHAEGLPASEIVWRLFKEGFDNGKGRPLSTQQVWKLIKTELAKEGE